MNNIILTGRLTKDPEVMTGDSYKVAYFTLAVPNTKDHTDFVPCKAFGKTAEVLEKYLKKGDRIGVEGRLEVSSYKTNEGDKRTAYTVVANRLEFLNDKKKEDADVNGAFTE